MTVSRRGFAVTVLAVAAFGVLGQPAFIPRSRTSA